MGSVSVDDHFYCRRDQVLSRFAAVPLFPRLSLPKPVTSLGHARGSSNTTFHFSRIRRGDSLPAAMARHEHFLFSQLNLRPKKTVLALSCGNGAVCEQLVQFSDVDVVGIDTDSHLISLAKIAAGKAGLAHRLAYYHARDISKDLERFPDCSFDAVFAIELGYRTTSLSALYEQIERLLKPSGRFATYEWCFTDTMNLSNADHVAAAQNLLRSLPKTARSISTITEHVSTLRATGFVNVSAVDSALRDTDIPWYRPLETQHSALSINSPLSLSWWYGQLSIGALLTAARLRIFSPMVLLTGEKSERWQ